MKKILALLLAVLMILGMTFFCAMAAAFVLDGRRKAH